MDIIVLFLTDSALLCFLLGGRDTYFTVAVLTHTPDILIKNHLDACENIYYPTITMKKMQKTFNDKQKDAKAGDAIDHQP
ncbi:MAG: hypothetical protein D3924_08395 [Candidatus Electrothrix sp. AR4]|nr:hypothetical protein [Candidatus Electrothrix sp. AR4]